MTCPQEAKRTYEDGLRDAARLAFDTTEFYQHRPDGIVALEDLRGALLERAGRDPKEESAATGVAVRDAVQRTDNAKPEPDWLKRTAEARDKAGWMAWDRATEILDAAAGDMPQPWRNATIALLAEHHPVTVIANVLSTLRCVSYSIPDSAWNHQAMMQRAIQTLEKLPHVPEPSKNGENPNPDLKSNLRKSIDRIGVLNHALARAVECLSEDPNPFHRDLAVQLSSLVANPWEDDGQPISNLALAGMLSSVLDAWRHEANQGDGIDENHAKLYEVAYGYIREYWPSFLGRPDRHAPLPEDKRPVELPPSLRRCLDVLVAGGTLVSSNECSAIEIACAQADNRFYVDANALGYVARPKRAAPKVDEEPPTEPKKLVE